MPSSRTLRFAPKSSTLYADRVVVLYAIAALAGACALISWLVWQTLAERQDAARSGPDDRFGMRGRSVVAGVLGFGLGGMSASYAGWGAVAIAGALAGAAFLIAAMRVLDEGA